MSNKNIKEEQRIREKITPRGDGNCIASLASQ